MGKAVAEAFGAVLPNTQLLRIKNLKCAILLCLCAAGSGIVSRALWAGETAAPPAAPEEKKAGDEKPPPKAEPDKSEEKKDLFEFSIRELMALEVTSASKTPEKASAAAAALHVITQEDIRRSGVTSIAEALRLAPGVQVARLNANQWALSIRGFTNIFANKLLVLMDGRSVYTPLFSGTFWDVQDTMLEDVDRIEVIRGPGATLWGSNAVNGVINIITKSSKDKETQGGLVTAGTGTEETGFGAVRYGGKIGKEIAIRGYLKYFERDDQALPGGDDASDEWRMARGGFRLDWDVTTADLLTVQGDLYGGEVGDSITIPSLTPPFSTVLRGDDRVFGGNLLSRWSHTLSDTSNLKVQLYYDRTEREKIGTARENRDTVDLDFQHQFAWGSRQRIVWGAGYRLSADKTERIGTAAFDPSERTTGLASAFIQDEITLLEKKLSLRLGVRGEYNDFTGLEVQPSGRLLWTPDERHTIWAAVSRAVRIPSRSADDVVLDSSTLLPGALGTGSPAAVARLLGDKDVESEQLLALDLGYRVQPHKRLSLDVAGFYNSYRKLSSTEPGAPFLETAPGPPHLVVPAVLDNKNGAKTFGGEAVATWQAIGDSEAARWRWRLQAQYALLRIRVDSHSAGGGAENAEEESPRNQFALRSMMDLPLNVQVDCALRYVDSVPKRDVPAYVTADARVGWRPNTRLELSLAGQNLLDNQHREWTTSAVNSQATEIQRSVYFKISWKF